ncbi:MAG: PAS domain S-box protein [Desulfuromonadales bacterium]
MTLSQRTVLIIVSTFIALLFIVAATSDVILLKSFASLEHSVLGGNVQKVRNEIDETYDELMASAKDVSAEIEHNGPGYVASLDISPFLNHRIDIIACFSASGMLQAAKAYDFHKRTPRKLPAHEISLLAAAIPLSAKGANGLLEGVFMVGSKPLQIVVRPISSTGSLILIGRYLDEEEVKRVSSLTRFHLDLIPVDQSAPDAETAAALAAFDRGETAPSHPIDSNSIAGYSLIKDIFGNSAVLVRVTDQRLLYTQGKAAIMYVLSAIFLTGCAFCGVMLFFIRGTILSRLDSLNSKVADITEQRDISARLPLSSHQDELHDLAVSINVMLESLESAEGELREGDERYRMLFERAPDAIIVIGMEGEEAGRIMAANQAAADQHGYSIEELCGLTIFDLNTEETNRTAGSIFERIAAGEWVTTEVWHRKKDGTNFPIEVHAGMIKIKGRNYVLGFDRDISVRKIAEESDRMYLDRIKQLNSELNQKALDLAAANSELEAFNYSVSHDMRGPLTRISGYCQILLEDGMVSDQNVTTYITRIYESGNWLSEMIDAMMQLAQLARVEFAPETVDLSETARNVVKELTLTDPDRKAACTIPEGISASGDSRLLKILMTNLLNNAWKYSSHSTDTRIEFGVMQQEAETVYYVRDNGAGFDMKDAGKLFRVFTRLHDQSQFSGTGIGLATVQRIVTRHGGHIWAEGETGKGAVFYFTLQPKPTPEGQFT